MLARTAQFRGHLNSCLPGYGAGVVGGGGYTDKLEWKEYKLTRRAFAMASPHFFWLEIANMDVVSTECECMHYAEFCVNANQQGKQTFKPQRYSAVLACTF